MKKTLTALAASALLVPALTLACPCQHEAKTTTAAVTATAGGGGDAPAAKQAKLTIPVEGMTCGGCVSNVQNALTAVEGVKAVEVSLEKNQAVVTCDESKVKPEQLTKAIDAAGYKAGKPVKN